MAPQRGDCGVDWVLLLQVGEVDLLLEVGEYLALRLVQPLAHALLAAQRELAARAREAPVHLGEALQTHGLTRGRALYMLC